MNEVSGRKRSKAEQVKGDTPEDRVKSWFTHFRNLLGDPPTVTGEDLEIVDVLTNVDIDDGPFSMEELRKVKCSLKQGKRAGPDDIPPEVLRNCELDEIMLEFCNMAPMANNMPTQWSLSNIIPLPKSGNLTSPDNYCGISLTCTMAKAYNQLILNRIRAAIDPKLRYNRNGFREKRSTVAQILALQRIIKEVKNKKLPAVLTFIDFKKAFDSIHRGKMI